MKKLTERFHRPSQVLKSFNESLVIEYLVVGSVLIGFLGAFKPLVTMA